MRHVLIDPELPDLLAEIESAFGNVRLGDGVSLHQARALDDYETEEAAAAARSFDTEERWQDISDTTIDRMADTLAFMDAAGFRFHVPRFMVFALTQAGLGSSSGSIAAAAAIYACDFSDESKDYVVAKYALLSSDQCAVIARFLRFASAHARFFDSEAATHALDRYWAAFGESA